MPLHIYLLLKTKLSRQGHISVHLSTHLFIHQSVHTSVCSSISPHIQLSISPCIHLSTHTPIHPFTYSRPNHQLSNTHLLSRPSDLPANDLFPQRHSKFLAKDNVLETCHHLLERFHPEAAEWLRKICQVKYTMNKFPFRTSATDSLYYLQNSFPC